ncbi:hypothetical protein LTR12_006569 [Friedmanniomyces endolithicus]|nr:hypothetical protein LTR12_006569 [Friedmanniomyces endolithicus]
MRTSRAAEQTLRAATLSRPPNYVCRACRAQAARQFHTSIRNHADIPFFQRLQQQLFGSKELQQAEKSREEKRLQQVEDLKQRGNVNRLEVKVAKNGQRYEVAAVVIPNETTDYVQEMHGKGLERIGSEAWVKARADQGEQYAGFVPKYRWEFSNKQWQMLLHHVIVEILTLQKAGRVPGDVCLGRRPHANSWQKTRKAKLKASTTGSGVTVSYPFPVEEERVLLAIDSSSPAESTLLQQSLTAKIESTVFVAGIASDGPAPAWMKVSIKDSSVKMALVKRILQITGMRVPDYAISSSTMADLYNRLRRLEKPKKVTETPQLQRLKIDAPNVNVFPNRRSSIDKERDIGRWKVIEEELVRRNLPVTGARWAGVKATWL